MQYRQADVVISAVTAGLIYNERVLPLSRPGAAAIEGPGPGVGKGHDPRACGPHEALVLRTREIRNRRVCPAERTLLIGFELDDAHRSIQSVIHHQLAGQAFADAQNLFDDFKSL